MTARDGAANITTDGRRWEFVDITDGPDDGEDWKHYIYRRRWEKDLALARVEQPTRWQVVFRFSYAMAAAFARSEEFTKLARYFGPHDMEGWFPNRLFGCRCFREWYPGALFRDYQGFDGMVPSPEDERARQQRISGN